MIDDSRGALDEEAVTKFRQQKQNYQNLVVTDSSAVDEYEKQIVQAVSEMAKTKRDLYEYNCGKNIRFICILKRPSSRRGGGRLRATKSKVLSSSPAPVA